MPQSLAIISANFPKDIRGKAIGTWAAASAVTTALGPPIGGFLIDLLSWRAAFWINLPLAVDRAGADLAGSCRKAATRARRGRSTGGRGDRGGRLRCPDLWPQRHLGGAGGRRRSSPRRSWSGLIGIAVYVPVERRAANPITPPALFRSKIFTSVNIVTVFLYGALSGVLFLLPFDLMNRRGLSAATTGLIMLPFGLIIGVLSRFTGALADSYGPRFFLVAGPLLVGAGALGFALDIPDLWLGVVLPVVLIGVRHGAGGLAAHHGGDERGARRQVGRGLGHQQCGEPAFRRLRHRHLRRHRRRRLRPDGAGRGALRRHPAGRRRGARRRSSGRSCRPILRRWSSARSGASLPRSISFVTLKGTAPPKKKEKAA